MLGDMRFANIVKNPPSNTFFDLFDEEGLKPSSTRSVVPTETWITDNQPESIAKLALRGYFMLQMWDYNKKAQAKTCASIYLSTSMDFIHSPV